MEDLGVFAGPDVKVHQALVNSSIVVADNIIAVSVHPSYSTIVMLQKVETYLCLNLSMHSPNVNKT